MIKTDTQIDLERFPEFDNHEFVSFFYYKKYGLKGLVAIHNTNLGPATGGTRMWHYPTLEAAVREALNLSKAMTYKCALAGVGFGGGKAVIISDPQNKTEEMLRAYGRVIDSWQGQFTTGTDVGVSQADTAIMAEHSKYILGQPTDGIFKQDTSKMASLGVFHAIGEILSQLYGTGAYAGRTVAIRGMGKLGSELARLLIEAGTRVYVSDIDQRKLIETKTRLPQIKIVDNSEINKLPVDVFSPNALGNEFNQANLSNLRAKSIVGGANNQLANDAIGTALFKKDIIYAPDYVVNAGGLINIVDELEPGGYDFNRVESRILNIKNTLRQIISLSEKKQQPTHLIADQMAEKIIYV